MKKIKIKNIAERYGVSPKTILDELATQGIELENASGYIPNDLVDLVEEYFEGLYGNKDKDAKKKDEEAGGAKIHLNSPIIVKNLAEALNRKPNEIISDLMKLGELASINQALPENIAKKLCRNYRVELVVDAKTKAQPGNGGTGSAPEDNGYELDPEPETNPKNLRERPPIVTFMGHVDHGKTSLQDKVRHTNVVAGESGRITQHIGASTIVYHNRPITFIDTPGHEAFTHMRSRGANVTDIVVLVVAADDGFKPQTVEALNHAKAAGVPIIVAINKIDLPDANPDRVLLQMQQNNLMSEDWGGEVGTVRVSAKTGEGIDNLLDRILLEAEILELKAAPKRSAKAIVIESQVEQGLGSTASVLVQDGTLKVGDIALCGEFMGKIKALFNDKGERVKSAGPSMPVRVVGLSGVPEAGARLVVCRNEKQARQEAEARTESRRKNSLAQDTIANVDDLFSRLNSQNVNSLQLIIKSDVKGSGEAIEDSLNKLPSDKIKVEVIMNSVGAITENDVMLAAASNAIIVGFHVRVNPGVNDLAKKQNVEIRLYSIIYELLNDITDALTGKLEPEKREKILGTAKILQIFELSKGPKVCGCIVDSGFIKVGAKARVFRQRQLIYNGEILSLRRFQDDVKEVKNGLECGIRLDNFADFLENDLIEAYEIELKKATL
ncbi:translation initiation factor IF-2 [Victivallis sp. Marseille-Q1083]|uniref:translation initiation factor IF-2 n=1 Tax=Victivallis sp. Marseille-Q1083 TaxID=2717288 RepID=UPI00158B1D85|nr:translation initiation factor IF-2 [Victivallis sp. Marseille-Q1083]